MLLGRFYLKDLNITEYYDSLGLVRIYLIKELLRQKGYDKIIMLGLDTFTCSYLDEFIDNDEDDLICSSGPPYSFIKTEYWAPKVMEFEHNGMLYRDVDFINADVNDPLSFDRASFTHILCTKTTLYQFKNKKKFFSNCYHWMIPNSYLIIHLVDRKRFSMFESKDPTKIEWQPLIPNKPKRRTNVTSEYEDFKYKAHYSFPVNLEETNIVSFTESFTDKVTNHVRHNEETLYMEDIRDILNMAKEVGFIFHAKVDMESLGDDNQYLYVLERPH